MRTANSRPAKTTTRIGSGKLYLPERPLQIGETEYSISPDVARLQEALEMVNHYNAKEGITPLTEINCEYHEGFGVEVKEWVDDKRPNYSREHNHHSIWLRVGTNSLKGTFLPEQLAQAKQKQLDTALHTGFAQYAVMGNMNKIRRNQGYVLGLLGSASMTAGGVIGFYEDSTIAAVLIATSTGLLTAMSVAGTLILPYRSRQVRMTRKMIRTPNLGLGDKHQEDLFAVPLLPLVKVG